MALPAPEASRVCLITGASSGIGREIAGVLAARGHGVVLVARREDRLREVATELSDRHGVRAEVIAADLSAADDRAGVLGAVRDLGLTVEVLVNNAGVSTTGRVTDAEVDGEMTTVRVNVEAVVHLSTLAVRDMVDRGRGVLLNVASTAAFSPLPGQAVYGGTKAFVLSYTQALRTELRGSGVTVTTLCPGPVHTEFGQAAGLTDEEMAGILPGPFWLTAGEVARQAVEGADAGRAVVIPGRANAVGAVVSHLAPRSALLPLIARQHPILRRPSHRDASSPG